LPTAVAVTRAVREAARFDRKLVSFDAGLLAAIPVASVLTVGIAIGKPVWGVTMGAGAMLAGIAWRVSGGRPPLALMATDAFGMALSTFIGSITGAVTWLHIAILCLWAALAGLLVSLGNRGGVVGTQAMIAFVVFGRLSGGASQALGLATLVLTGGLAQVAFLSIVRWPLPLRNQRAATGAAYRALSSLAAASDEASTIPAAQAIDAAETALASPAMFGDAAVTTLRSLVNEAYRLRVQLMAVHVLLRQLSAAGTQEAAPDDSPVRQSLSLTAAALDTAAQAIQGDTDAARRLERRAAELDVVVQSCDGGDPALHIDRRPAALAGQVRAVAAVAGRGRGRRPAQPPAPPTHQPAAAAGARRPSNCAPTCRCNPRRSARPAAGGGGAPRSGTELLPQRSYWMVVAAATWAMPRIRGHLHAGAERAWARRASRWPALSR
jgi:hypothetical protein